MHARRPGKRRGGKLGKLLGALRSAYPENCARLVARYSVAHGREVRQSLPPRLGGHGQCPLLAGADVFKGR